jgi:type VI protein secretion system component VasF
MKHPLWSAIYDLFQDIETFLTTGEISGPSPEMMRPATARMNVMKTQQLKVEGLRAAFDQTEDMLSARGAIRARLDVLKASLSATLNEREVYLVLFPVVVFSDEMVKNKFPEKAASWPPLQKELFRIDNGGEVFYETLDDLLRKPDTLPFVYEVYYFAINYGFRGKYADNLAKINEYKAKVEAKIPLPKVDARRARAGTEAVHAEKSPYWYYAASGAFLVGAYAVLYAIASV